MNRFSTSCEEIKAIFRHLPIWFMLATQDIKLKYRRSTIGPLWITISMAVTVYSMGFLYAHLFKINLATYFPHLASGIICWSLISTLLQEATNSFIESEAYIKNQESFMSLFMMRTILKNLIIFLHNIIVYIPIIFIFETGLSFKILLIFPGLMILCLNVFIWGNLLAIVGTRFRDFPQIITSIIQVVFFLTPIMWLPSLLPERFQWVVVYNPFNQFLNLIRQPLMDRFIEIHTILIVSLATVIGYLIYAMLIHKYKNRIVYWL